MTSSSLDDELSNGHSQITLGISIPCRGHAPLPLKEALGANIKLVSGLKGTAENPAGDNPR